MSSSQSMVGKTVLHYRILDKLGAGGMGIVYKAEDTQLKRLVAIKFLSVDALMNPLARQRFTQEARAAAKLDHPSICTVHQIAETEQGSFIVMSFIDGQTIQDRIRHTHIDIEDGLEWARQIASGIHEAHKAGIIHRDIKASNIMIDRRSQIKIMDFGIAKVVEGPELTKIGSTLGTLAYMSPEQVRGKQVDHRSDIWSLGVVFYEIFTGQRPFTGKNYDLMNAIVEERPKPPSQLNGSVPGPLDRIIARCLTKPLDERYQSLEELLEDLDQLIDNVRHGTISMQKAMAFDYDATEIIEQDQPALTEDDKTVVSAEQSAEKAEPAPETNALSDEKLREMSEEVFVPAEEKEKPEPADAPASFDASTSSGNKGMLFGGLALLLLFSAGFWWWQGSDSAKAGNPGIKGPQTNQEQKLQPSLEEQALTAQTRMNEAEASAMKVEAMKHASTKVESALRLKAQATQALEAGEFKEAERFFKDAAKAFAGAETIAHFKSAATDITNPTIEKDQ